MTHVPGVRSPARTLRSLQVGDTWRYQVTGRIVPPVGDELPVTGTIAVSVASHTPSDTQALLLDFSQTLRVTHPDGPRELPAPAWMFAFVQDPATMDVAIVADNMGPGGAWRVAQTPRVFYPGTWSGHTAYANRLQFQDGDFVANTLLVTRQEQVATAAGVFQSWVADITSESPLLGAITGTDWWAPELGAPARFETASRMPDGARMLLQAVLASTNVAPDASRAG